MARRVGEYSSFMFYESTTTLFLSSDQLYMSLGEISSKRSYWSIDGLSDDGLAEYSDVCEEANEHPRTGSTLIVNAEDTAHS